VLLVTAQQFDVPIGMTPLVAVVCIGLVLGLALVSGLIAMSGLLRADPAILTAIEPNNDYPIPTHPSSSIAKPSLIADKISKSFTSGLVSIQILSNLSLAILPNELTLISGPSGCGKVRCCLF